MASTVVWSPNRTERQASGSFAALIAARAVQGDGERRHGQTVQSFWPILVLFRDQARPHLAA